MYFHLIGIKEREGTQFELDFLIQGGDEVFIRKFLANRGVVIVSITEFKEDSNAFGNVSILVSFENTDIQIITAGEDLADRAYFFISLGLSPHFINFIENPIPDGEMQKIIKSASERIIKENEQIQKEKEEKEEKEKEKYSESAIDDTLKIINQEIDYIEQTLKAGTGILSSADIKTLEELGNEMKKIRLGTNFNKMASLILDAHEVRKKAEKEIFAASDSKKFLIDKNSVTTNIDFISELSTFNRITEKGVVQPNGLTTDESFRNIFGISSVFVRMFFKDCFYAYKQSSLDEIFGTTVRFIEYITLIAIVVISLARLASLLLGLGKFSLYLLPALGRLGLLLYLFNSLKLNGPILKIVGFTVIAGVYRYGLILLNGTFSL